MGPCIDTRLYAGGIILNMGPRIDTLFIRGGIILNIGPHTDTPSICGGNRIRHKPTYRQSDDCRLVHLFPLFVSYIIYLG